jgi:crotonobetainyl-CoA:carnitine CoA-transferase CaiB-like acyl-CoA transferase
MSSADIRPPGSSTAKPLAPLPLQGIRVIDYTHFLAGPYLSRCLGALGAEVIKVERPTEGEAGRHHPYFIDGQSGYHLQQNMGKQGLCVNIKDPRGLKLVQDLAATADVFVENYRPGAMDRMGLGWETLSALNPRLVYCSVSAFGQTGPDAGRPGFGVIAEARSGAMAVLGVPGEPPPLFRMPIADMYAGIHGVAAVCAALVGRNVTGRGARIDTALYDCMVSMHDYSVQCYTLSGGRDLPQQTGHDLPGSTVYGVFPALDGTVVIAAQVDDAWKRLARVIGGEPLAADKRFHTPAGRNEHRLDALAHVKAWTQGRTVEQCCAALDAVDVPCAPVRNIDAVLADPQVAARGMIIEQEHPVLGRVRLANVPFRFEGLDTTPRSVAPLLGQHNREIAASTGLSEAQIDALERDGVLHAEPAARRGAAS